MDTFVKWNYMRQFRTLPERTLIKRRYRNARLAIVCFQNKAYTKIFAKDFCLNYGAYSNNISLLNDVIKHV